MATEETSLEKALQNIFQGSGITLKGKQIEAIRSILFGRDTLCIFPTGFGKSLIFQCLPKLAATLTEFQHENPAVIVMSPLLSLIEDQVNSANSMKHLGLRACALNNFEQNCSDLSSGMYNIFFGTPEAWLQNPK